MNEEMWANAVGPDPGKTHIEVVYDPDLGCIAQATHPDGTVVTAADAMLGAAVWGSASVVIAADGSLSDLQSPANLDGAANDPS